MSLFYLENWAMVQKALFGTFKDTRQGHHKDHEHLCSRNRDISQNVILQGCELEKSRSSVKVKNIFIITLLSAHNYMWSFIEISLPVFSSRVEESLIERWPGERKQKKERRSRNKHFDSGWHIVMQITSWRINLM